MSVRFQLLAAAAAATLVSAPALAVNETFDTSVTLSSTQAAGTWYTDRYAPAGFSTGVFDGDNRLNVHISSADSGANRPAAYSDGFYNTQGRKFDLEAGTKIVSIDLYVSSDWQGVGRRAGFWGTGLDQDGDISAYPILAFIDGTFQGWDVTNGGYTSLGLPTGFVYDSWVHLSYELGGGKVTYTVGDKSQSWDDNGTVQFTNVILQGYNTDQGVDYDIHWDNLTSAVPEPASWAMMIGGFALAGAAMRRKKMAFSHA